jgi:hypothetical protein
MKRFFYCWLAGAISLMSLSSCSKQEQELAALKGRITEVNDSNKSEVDQIKELEISLSRLNQRLGSQGSDRGKMERKSKRRTMSS